MQNIKDEIFNLKKELEAKEQQYAHEQQKQIHNLEKQIDQLKNNSDNKLEQLEIKKTQLDEEIKYLKEASQKKKNETDSILQKAKNSVEDFIKSRNEISKKNEEIKELKLQNSNILNQQINISNMTFIQELSLIQLDIKIQEYKDKKITDKKVYRGLFDVSYSQKIGVDLKNLTYELSKDKKVLSVYNVQIITSLAKTPKIEKVFSEIREKQEKIMGFGNNGWIIYDEQGKDVLEEDIQIQTEIQKNIDDNFYTTGNISIIEHSFDKAIEQYLRNITGNNFEIKICKEINPKALDFKNCFESYNRDLNTKIKDVPNSLNTIESIEERLVKNIDNLIS